MVLQLRRLGRRMRAGHRRRQHVLPRRRDRRRAPIDDRPFDGLRPVERHELLGAQGGRRGRPGDVPHGDRAPARRGSGCPTTSATGSRTSAPSSTSDWWPTSSTSTGRSAPLGAELRPPAHRRRRRRGRAARTSSARTRSSSSSTTTTSTAVHQVVAEHDARGARRRRRDEPPPSGTVAFRPRPAAPGVEPARAVGDRRACVELVDRLQSRPLPRPPEPGVPRRRRRPGTSASSASSGRRARRAFTAPGRSCPRRPVRRRRLRTLREPLRLCPGAGRRTCSCSTPACARPTPAPSTRGCATTASCTRRGSTCHGRRWDDEDEPDDDDRGRLDRQAGHGTFISGDHPPALPRRP